MTSLLLAVVLGALLVFGWLSIIAATTSAYQARVTQPIEVIEVSGGGRRSPDGKIGSVEEINVAGGEAGRPGLEQRGRRQRVRGARASRPGPPPMLDTVAEAGENLAEVDVSAVMPRGERVATGKRRSKIGNGGPGYGFGPGDGGVRREDRWSILYKTGQTADEYARQLDAFGVELAIIVGQPADLRLELLAGPADQADRQRARTTSGSSSSGEGKGGRSRTSPCWPRPASRSARGSSSSSIPPGTESTLEQLEVRYKGKQPAEIRNTRFGVVPAGSGYEFEVLSQEYLR